MSGLQVPIADCRDCSFRASLLAAGRCTPGDSCVAAQSGRQIDRFFRNTPQVAVQYLADPFWERRAIAVRYAPLEELVRLVDDSDEVVRRAVAYRLPREQLATLMHDEDREVRITVADRLPPEQLERMAEDPDYLVRGYVVQRIAPGRLFRFMRDADREVRKRVAQRLPEESLGLMMFDAEPEIRRIVASRLRGEDLLELLHDPDWTVRLAAVENAPLAALRRLDEHDPEVRRALDERLQGV
ncbi:4Fe4S-binding leucine-rich repeat protein [Stutzerimonas kirkiae]|uniref:(Fe-S) protein n=1 Tax=Stutzerimonas kirkiae TaxID=2211392 RepID=A0A4Q9RCE3_9GAMM|nr:4Fe4S-binding leucine-rich repeat protein [Stutzerimonas kirkiae]TBU98822.1 (Fe-S) protein [Stutzerimonas kirkiae]TBV03916.1 (Fe-S) protein [Stutzerimonas kirkiae]TBV09671.1 (Fe-S) protein [Stutzerimonas kirkiae]TBV16796.1 (Fe-S) protein [Stutzerimonas kirkiae]